ncbi:glycerophosphodiester phosphodiesterase family protein [Paenibacillus sp. FSL H8-0034]|uniref:glycerophosphodiester phosphodiesterase family protein n=1 Tax=Paenibacillus sp. FSL H8-0034 TaxID=2954671 RepID=UPI0030F88156
MVDRIENSTSFIVSAHRGWKSKYPENTLLAFQEALEFGADMLEFDLRFSKDHEVVVIHDETLDRTTNGSGKVSDYTLAELKQLDAGGWFGSVFEGLKIPSFDEMCQMLKAYPEVLLLVEIKTSPDAKEVADQAVAMLKEYGYLARCAFVCFDAELLGYLHDVYQLKIQGFPSNQMSNFVPGPNGTYSKMWSVGFNMKILTPELVKEFDDMGIRTWSYCPDTDQQVYYSLGCGIKLMTVNDLVPALEIRKQIESRAANLEHA